jgi:hypothetical protein
MIFIDNYIKSMLCSFKNYLSADHPSSPPCFKQIKKIINKCGTYSGAIIFIAIFCSQIFLNPYLCAAATISIQPGQNIQSAVGANPEGTTFVLKPGLYRFQAIIPKNGNTFIGESGAILSGARYLSSFQSQGQYWVTSSPTDKISAPGKCEPDSPACVLPEDLFVNDVPLKRVTSLSNVGPGKWYLDYSTDKIYLGENPHGKKVEISETRHAFYGSAKNVTIRGLIIEKYANPAQTGAVHAMVTSGPLSHNWKVENNEIRLNHGGGIRIGDRIQLINNNIHHNGQIGIIGTGNDVLVEDNEIAHNNYAGYYIGWEAGGTKFVSTENLVVRNNFVHHNQGPGLWTDIDNYNVLYEYNQTTASGGVPV